MIRYRLLGVAAVLLLGIAHGVHDLSSGNAPLPAFLPTVTVALQIATLSMGQAVAARRAWPRAVAFTLATLVSLAFGSAAVALHATRPSTPSGAFFATAFAGMGVFGLWLLVFYFPAKLLAARVRALDAEANLQRAELARLRANLHPHFLLNTLNAIAGLLVAEPRSARRLVAALGDLLRDSVEDEGAMRSLAEEVAWLRRYAEIFEIRHQGAIRFEWDLAAKTLATAVPSLLLQPLVENAIEHGALRRAGGGRVTLRSREAGDTIEISVSDDGPGMAPERPAGLGLRLVEDRFNLAYPAGTMAIATSSSGTCVTLTLPVKMEKPRCSNHPPALLRASGR
jgi:two-component sensor histidine kinase